MKFISVAVAALLGMVAIAPESTEALKVGEDMSMNKLRK